MAPLCVYCRGFFPIEDKQHTTRPFHPNFSALTQHSDSCTLCGYIAKFLLDDEKAAQRNDPATLGFTTIQIRLREPNTSGHAVGWALLEVSLKTTCTGLDSVVRYTFSITTTQNESKGSNEPLHADSKSDPSVENKISVIRTWLQDCESQHGSDCMPLQSQLPLRLIDVGSDHVLPKLILSSELRSHPARYVTLSHCWGKHLPVRTVKANLTQFSTEISFDVLPRTFSDAIKITRHLGIRYLWIDSFCIVQDNSSEWEREALKMKDIYSGGVLNIAAADATGSQEGCFRDLSARKSDRVTTFDIQLPDLGHTTSVRIQPGDFRNATKDTIISTRGWILQEQLLSHRVVSCMDSELHWECRSTYRTESGASFTQDAPSIHTTPRLFSTPSVQSPHTTWWNWMQNFSQRHFSYWKDRQAALAGIVQHYQDITKDEPLLGLWKRKLISDLCWIRLSIHKSISEEELRHANLPSWSWLSCPAVIGFDIWTVGTNPNLCSDEDCSVLLDHEIIWTGLPFVSTIKSAQIILEGPTMELSIKVPCDARLVNPPQLDVQYAPDGVVQEKVLHRCVGQFDHDVPVCSSDKPFVCILLRSKRHSQSRFLREIFLILQSVKRHPRCQTYRRVGLGCFIGEFAEFRRSSRRQITLI